MFNSIVTLLVLKPEPIPLNVAVQGALSTFNICLISQIKGHNSNLIFTLLCEASQNVMVENASLFSFLLLLGFLFIHLLLLFFCVRVCVCASF